eukprot:scaffold832_cov256-Skeletonema_marinoi.AAC.7
MADQTGRTMARMMVMLIQMESNWAEKTARMTSKAICDDGYFAFVDAEGSVQRLKCQQDLVSINTQDEVMLQPRWSSLTLQLCPNERDANRRASSTGISVVYRLY